MILISKLQKLQIPLEKFDADLMSILQTNDHADHEDAMLAMDADADDAQDAPNDDEDGADANT